MKDGYTIDDYRNLFCFPIINYYYKMGYTFEDETYEELSVEFTDLYKELFPKCTIVDGVKSKLKEAIDKGYQNVIVSACEHSMLNEQVDNLGISKYFSHISGIDNILGGSKVDMAKKWFREAKIKSEDCIYIGDTLHDLETAKALGIDECYLVSSGHQSYDVLRREHDRVVRSVKEVVL